MQEQSCSGPLRTRIYIDGYNFYYGCLKGTPFKWLDLLELFEFHVLPSVLTPSDIGPPRASRLVNEAPIKFFTAKILENVARAPDSVSSQARYHTALRKLHGNRIQLIEGYYAVNKMNVRLVDRLQPDQLPRLCDEVQAWKVEEKQSDVNLALHAYHDALLGVVDHVVFVTNDTDISPALQMIRDHTAVMIGLVTPTSDRQRVPNTALAKLAHWVRTHITTNELAASQLPRVISGRKPTTKPDSWHARPDLLQHILGLAIPICGDRGKAFKWLEKPNPYLSNRRPVELIENEEGARKVIDYINDWLHRSESDI